VYIAFIVDQPTDVSALYFDRPSLQLLTSPLQRPTAISKTRVLFLPRLVVINNAVSIWGRGMDCAGTPPSPPARVEFKSEDSYLSRCAPEISRHHHLNHATRSYRRPAAGPLVPERALDPGNTASLAFTPSVFPPCSGCPDDCEHS